MNHIIILNYRINSHDSCVFPEVPFRFFSNHFSYILFFLLPFILDFVLLLFFQGGVGGKRHLSDITIGKSPSKVDFFFPAITNYN